MSRTRAIRGTLTVGSTVTLAPDPWYDPAGSPSDIQWLRNCLPISGATASTYKVRAADKGTNLTVRVTGSRFGYTTVSKTSGAPTVQ